MEVKAEDEEAVKDLEKNLKRRILVETLKKAWTKPLLSKRELAMEGIGWKKQMMILATSR